MSSVVMTNSSPAARRTGPPGNSPRRIFGPWRSAKMPTPRPVASDPARTRRYASKWSAWWPWLMLSRATSMPALISAVICSWLEVAGPRVQTIFARRLMPNPLPVVYTTLAHPATLVTRVTKCSTGGGPADAGRLTRVPRDGGCLARGVDPVLVARLPGPVGLLLGQDGVDEADEVRVLLGHREAVGLVLQAGAHHLGERVLGGETVQDRVVGGDRRHLILLQEDQAVGPERDLDGGDLRPDRVVLDRVHRVGAGRRAYLLAAKVGQAAGRDHVVGDEHPLVRVEVDAGEVNLRQALTGDRHRMSHDVDAAAGDGGDSLRVGDRLELDPVGVAEDRLGHGADHVDVEPLDLAVERVEVAEVIGALVHPGDQVALLLDRGHERAGGHFRRAGRREAGGVRVARGAGGLRAGLRLADRAVSARWAGGGGRGERGGGRGGRGGGRGGRGGAPGRDGCHHEGRQRERGPARYRVSVHATASLFTG